MRKVVFINKGCSWCPLRVATGYTRDKFWPNNIRYPIHQYSLSSSRWSKKDYRANTFARLVNPLPRNKRHHLHTRRLYSRAKKLPMRRLHMMHRFPKSSNKLVNSGQLDVSENVSRHYYRQQHVTYNVIWNGCHVAFYGTPLQPKKGPINPKHFGSRASLE